MNQTVESTLITFAIVAVVLILWWLCLGITFRFIDKRVAPKSVQTKKDNSITALEKHVQALEDRLAS